MRIFSDELVAEAVRVNHVADLSHATIGETLLVAQYLLIQKMKDISI